MPQATWDEIEQSQTYQGFSPEQRSKVKVNFDKENPQSSFGATPQQSSMASVPTPFEQEHGVTPKQQALFDELPDAPVERSSMSAEPQKQVEPVDYDRGFIGDTASSLARGTANVAKMAGGAMRTMDFNPDDEEGFFDKTGSKLKEWGESAPERSDIYRPDAGASEEGFAKKTYGMALESLPASGAPFASAAAGAVVGSVVPGFGTAAGALVGGAAGLVGMFGFGTYENTRGEAKKHLKQTRPDLSDDEVNDMSHSYGLKNAAFEVGTEAVGDLVALLTFGGSKVLTQPLKATVKNLTAGGRKEALKKFGVAYLKDMPVEAASEVVAAWGQAEAGKDIGIGDGFTAEQAKEAIGVSAWMSAMLGGGISGASYIQSKRSMNSLNSDDKDTREKAADEVAGLINGNFNDPELAKQWREKAQGAIDKGTPMVFDEKIVDFAEAKMREDKSGNQVAMSPGMVDNQGGGAVDPNYGETLEFSPEPKTQQDQINAAIDEEMASVLNDEPSGPIGKAESTVQTVSGREELKPVSKAKEAALLEPFNPILPGADQQGEVEEYTPFQSGESGARGDELMDTFAEGGTPAPVEQPDGSFVEQGTGEIVQAAPQEGIATPEGITGKAAVDYVEAKNAGFTDDQAKNHAERKNDPGKVESRPPVNFMEELESEESVQPEGSDRDNLLADDEGIVAETSTVEESALKMKDLGDDLGKIAESAPGRVAKLREKHRVAAEELLNKLNVPEEEKQKIRAEFAKDEAVAPKLTLLRKEVAKQKQKQKNVEEFAIKGQTGKGLKTASAVKRIIKRIGKSIDDFEVKEVDGRFFGIRNPEQPKVETVDNTDSVAHGQDVNTNPSEAQKEAENYKKGHVKLDGMDITIENPAGSTRSGKDQTGKEWSIDLKHDYGYFKGSTGFDKDHVDVFFANGYTGGADNAYIVNQYNKDGSFDEHKVVIGADSKEFAMATYNSNYEKGWNGGKSVAVKTMPEFKKWVMSNAPKNGPAIDDVKVDSKYEKDLQPKPGQGTSKSSSKPEKPSAELDINLPKGTVVGGTKEIVKLYTDVVAGKIPGNKKIAVRFQIVSGDDAVRLKENTGYDLEGFKHTVDSFGLRKINKDHGTKKTETPRGQIPITVDDIAKIPLIIKEYDSVEATGQDSTGNDLIRYRKSFNGEIVYVEEVRSKRKELMAKTMWKTHTHEPMSQKTPARTSETLGSNPPHLTKNIPTKQQKVKEGASDIADFGDKLGGARKDYYATLESAEKLDTSAVPLSKSWPEPKYEALLESGVPPYTVGLVRAMREDIPNKPRARYRLSSYVANVEMRRGVAQRNLEGGMSVKDLKEWAERTMPEASGRAELYEKFGHDVSLKGVSFASHHYSLYKGEKDVDKWVVEKKAKASAFGNWPTQLAVAETKKEALGKFAKIHKAMLEEKGKDKAQRKVKFEVYSYRRQEGVWWIGKKVGGDHLDLKKFDSVKEARSYLAENQGKLEELLKKAKHIPPSRRAENRERVGDDYRNGEDVTPEMFTEAFGFRGVEFGNWVKAKGERQASLNRAYDALLDLANTIGIPTQAISLNGELGLAFGARGKGGQNPAAAHYEPDKIVINLTRKAGPGSLAHEWWHSLDNYFSRMRKDPSKYMTERPYELSPKNQQVRKEMVAAFKGVMKSIKETDIENRSRNLDKKRTKGYWAKNVEMSARAFESYMVDVLGRSKQSSDYLVNIQSEGTFDANEYPYLTKAEIPVVRKAFDNFFKTVKTKKTDKGTALYSKSAKPLPKNQQANIPQELRKKLGRGYNRLIRRGIIQVLPQDKAMALLERVGGAKFMVAFHGSPHDFDKFSTDNIGSGEGFQAYGSGLYFAGNKDVAEWYKKKLSNGVTISDRHGNKLRDAEYLDDDQKHIVRVAELSGYDDIKDFVKYLHDTIAEHENMKKQGIWINDVLVNYFAVLDSLDGATLAHGKGKLYQVTLAPKQDEYLLWDKPLSEQSDKVLAAAKKAWNKTYDDPFNPGEMAKDFYRDVSMEELSPEGASEYLHSLGIRGIKYADGMTRNKKDQNFNYVIFDDADVSIDVKYSKETGLIEAFNYTDPKTGKKKVVMIDGAVKKNDAYPVLLHEISHTFLPETFKGKQWDNLVKSFERHSKRDTETGESVRAAKERVPDGTPANVKSEEMIAYYITDNAAKDQTLYKRILLYIKKALIRMGIPASILIPNDIVALTKGYLDKQATGKKSLQVGVDEFAQPAKTSPNIMKSVAESPFAQVTKGMLNSPAFKRWFGKSRLVNKSGDPITVFHGSPADFFEFGKDKESKSGHTSSGLGDFFTMDQSTAKKYGTVKAFHLRMEKPYTMSLQESQSFKTQAESKARKEELQAQGYDSILIKVPGKKAGSMSPYLIVFDGNQVKSAEKNTGDFSRSNNDVRFSQAFSEDFASVAPGTMRFIKPEKKDMAYTEVAASTPEYSFEKDPAAKRVLQAQLDRHDKKTELEHEILGENYKDKDGSLVEQGEFLDFTNKLQKEDEKSYKKANKYLVEIDQTGEGFRLKKDGVDWLVIDPSGKRVEAYESEQQAAEEMIAFESEHLRDIGFSEDAIKAVALGRELTGKAFDILIADLRRIMQEAEEAGLPTPRLGEVDESGRFGVYDGKKLVSAFETVEAARESMTNAAKVIAYTIYSKGGAKLNDKFTNRNKAEGWIVRHGGIIKERNKFGNLEIRKREDSELRPLTLQEAIAQMGDLRGVFFPRLREPGKFVMKARKDGENPIRMHFDIPGFDESKGRWKGTRLVRSVMNTAIPAAIKVKELRKKGYNVTIEKDTSVSEDVFDATNLTSSLDAILQEAMSVADKNDSDQIGMAKQINKILTLQVADIFKARGYLSTRMKRTEEVWEGYEEDMQKSLVQYGKNLAAGVAKRDAAQKMILAFSGRDYSWNEYKEEVENPEWDEYKQIVEDRRVHPGKQKILYGQVRNFITDVLRNDEYADRMIGTMRGLAAIKFLGFRVSSAAVNMTNMVQGVPATISAHTDDGLVKALGRVKHAAILYGKYRSGKGELSTEDRDVFQDITNRGWDQAQYNAELASALQSKLGEKWTKFTEYAMFMFGAAEKANRSMSIFAAYQAMKDKHPSMDYNNLMEKAKHVSDRAHGIYGKETLPAWARGKANPLKLTYTFQKFSHNYILNMLEMGFQKKDLKAAAYMLLSPAILAGTGATLATPFISLIASAFGIGGDDPEEEFYKWAENTFGSDRFARHGLAGLAGVNLKGSLQVNNPMPTRLSELFGAPQAIFTDTKRGIENISKGEYYKGFEALVPTAFGNMSKAIREGSEGVTTSSYSPVYYGDDPLKGSSFDMFARFLSFNPARLSGVREMQWSEKKVAKKYQERRKNINSKFKKAMVSGDLQSNWPELWKEVYRYNELVRGSGRNDISFITPKSIRNMLKRASRPTKTERLRKAM